MPLTLSRQTTDWDHGLRGASEPPQPQFGEARPKPGASAMISRSEAMAEVSRQIERVAPTQATVLVTGESGTGKELVAQAVHQLSPRRNRPFITLNCGAISPQLIESELFGHEKGSFTGAIRRHRGVFERAHGGTLLLDEITETSLALQIKLLRVLETGRITRLGGDHEISTDVRVVAATNCDPQMEVEEGRMRLDLMYRLNVFPIHIPPLRERPEDIPCLTTHFLDQENRAAGTQKGLTREAMAALSEHSWPGNVRELNNVITRAFILADRCIGTEQLTLNTIPAPAEPEPELSIRVGDPLAEAERKLILATLDRCHGHRRCAADMLGISLKTLYNRLQCYR